MGLIKVAEISIDKLEDRKTVTAILHENGYTVGPGKRKKTETGKQLRAEHMMAHGSLYQFNVIGLALCGMHIRWKRRRHYFCSQFVSEVLEKSGAMELPKHSTLMHPNDYTRLEELRCVYKGTLAGLPQRQQMEFDQNDTVISVYLGLALGLFHTGAARVWKIF